MAITVEELAARLNAEAARRGISTEELITELASQLPTDDPLESFIGCAASDRTEPFDIHRERAELAAKRSTEGV